MPNPTQNDQEPVVLKPVEARQGLLGRPVLVVLVVSISLAIAAMIFSGIVSLR
jgi:hypothetical protein